MANVNTNSMNIKAGNASATVQATVTDALPAVPCPGPAGYTYTGMRYVPVFSEPVEWNKSNSYESLTIVTYNGDSYTSKQAVPSGIDITNTSYWVKTGNFNAQLQSAIDYMSKVDASIRCFKTLNDVDDSLNEGDLVYLEGRNESGDGNNAWFVYSTTADTSIFSINVANGYLNAFKGVPFNIGFAGCTNDGVTDNTMIINNYFNSITTPYEFVIPSNCFFRPDAITNIPVGSIVISKWKSTAGEYTWNAVTSYREDTELNDNAYIISSPQSAVMYLHNQGGLESTSSKLGRASLYFASGWTNNGSGNDIPNGIMRLYGSWETEAKTRYNVAIGTHQESFFSVNNNGFATVGSSNPLQSTLCVSNNRTDSSRLLEIYNTTDNNAQFIIFNTGTDNFDYRYVSNANQLQFRANTNVLNYITSGYGQIFTGPIDGVRRPAAENFVIPSFPYCIISGSGSIENINFPSWYTPSGNTPVLIELVFESAGVNITDSGNVETSYTSTGGDSIKLLWDSSLTTKWRRINA